MEGPRRPAPTRAGGIAAAWLAALSLLGSGAAAQEVDRAGADPDRPHHLAPPEDEPLLAEPAPVVSAAPGSTVRPPRFADEPFELPALEAFDAGLAEPADEVRADEPKRASLTWQGQTRVASGYDDNVFRADRGETRDGFWRVHGELELLVRLPNGGELFGEVSGETLQYFEQHPANEHYVATFFEYFQPLATWADAGVQNAAELSRLNLLDDNGDLFPRGRFGSLDEEIRLFTILRPPGAGEQDEDGLHPRDFALELGASYRLKDYEENSGVDSLDYQELRLDASISAKLARNPRSRLKLKYRFRRRDYREFRARTRAGSTAPDAPHLDLERHQLNLTWYQDLEISGVRARLSAGVGAVYNRDLFENDRSYREASFTLSVECWVVPDATRLDVAVRAVGRDFLVRAPSVGSGHLRHRLLTVTLGVWQRVLGLREERARDDWLTLSAFAEGAMAAWRSGDPDEDYDRLVIQAGLEASF